MNFRKSETFLILLGLIMMGSSTFFLFTGHSLVHPKSQSEDPFHATYSGNLGSTPITHVLPAPTSEPLSLATPGATLPLATVTPSPNESPNELANRARAYLLYPRARAVLLNAGNLKTGYPIQFKFEIDPKTSAGTFELRFEDQIIISKPVSGSPNGLYQVSVVIRKPGLYHWKVLTPSDEGEVREVTVK